MRMPGVVSSVSCALGLLLFFAPNVSAQSGLVAAYGFDETSSATATDASGHGNQGTISGATRIAGRFGGALNFDGTNDWITIADAPSLDLSAAMTIEAWVYPTSGTKNHAVISKEDGANGAVYAIYSSGNNFRPNSEIVVNGSNRENADGSGQLPVNVWTHLAATYDGTRLRLFVNGVEVGNRNVSGTIRASSGPLRVGGNTIRADFFAGRLDEVRVYARALSAAEIRADMSTPVVPPPPIDSAPPTVSITTPAQGAVVSGVTTVSAAATDDIGVVGVQFRLDDAPLGSEDTAAPFSAIWDAQAAGNGLHTLTAVARDAAGHETTSPSVSVTVSNDLTAPEVSITWPTAGETVSGRSRFRRRQPTISASPECSSGSMAFR
jgi:hypothetical protein